MAFADNNNNRFWETDILSEYFQRMDPEARRLAGKEIAPDPSDDYHYGMGDYTPIPAPPVAASRPLPRRPGPPVSFQPGGAHVPAPPPGIPVDPAIGMNAGMDQMAPDFNVPMIPNRPGTPTIVRQIPTGPEHQTMDEMAPEVRTVPRGEKVPVETFEDQMEEVEFNPAAGSAPGISDQEAAILAAEREESHPSSQNPRVKPQSRRGTGHLPEGTVGVFPSNAPTFEHSGGMIPTPIPPGGLGRGTEHPEVEVDTSDGYPGMFPALVETEAGSFDDVEDIMSWEGFPEPSRDMAVGDYDYTHEEIVAAGEGPEWKENASLSEDQRVIYNHHKETLGPAMANNIAAHYTKLKRENAENYQIGDKIGGKTYKGNGRWVNANGAATAPPIKGKKLSIKEKDDLHKKAIFNANRSQAEHIARQERVKNAPVHTPEELAYLHGEVDYGHGGVFGSGYGITGESRRGLSKRIGPNHRARVAKEIDRLDQEEGTGIYEGSGPMRSVGQDGTVTNYDRTVKNRDGSETITVTKRGRTMQYTVGRNGQIIDGSVRYLSGDELSRNSAGAQQEYYESNVDDPRWRARNDPQLRRRHGSPEDIDRAVERSLPKRV